jgi:hypothetical protein
MKIDYKNKYDKIISLGFNCFIKRFKQQELKISEETDLFDYIGTPMWGINLFIQNDFTGLDKKNEYINMKINEKKTMITNKQYYFRFLHDLTNENLNNIFDEFVNKYTRRIERFKNIIINQKNILFIRIEEDQNRIKHKEYKDKYKRTEIDYLQEFCGLITAMNPDLHFKIIYISKSLQNNVMDKIIILNDPIAYKWESAHRDIRNTLDRHNAFLEKLI